MPAQQGRLRKTATKAVVPPSLGYVCIFLVTVTAWKHPGPETACIVRLGEGACLSKLAVQALSTTRVSCTFVLGVKSLWRLVLRQEIRETHLCAR